MTEIIERPMSTSEWDSAVKMGAQAARAEYDAHGFDGEDAFRDNVHGETFGEAVNMDVFSYNTAAEISDAVDQGIRDFLASPDFLNQQWDGGVE